MASKVKFRPLHDKVLVKRLEGEETTAGGIIIPDTAQEQSQEGKVVAVGNGAIGDDGKVRKLDVKPGDSVLFSKYGGTDINIEGESYVVMKEEDILAVIA
ncbi:MAG: co-chaperone GroES [Thermodesulfobacteriota bacterium]